MNAHALLTSQGWRGQGHSLHPTDNSIGLSKPLLVSKKQDNLGIGQKQHRTSDMWWMNAFDSSLKGLDTSKEGQVVQTVTSGGLDMVANGGAKWVGSGGGLYASFVRGECLSGTITPEEIADENGQKKRKWGEDEAESKEERRARKAKKAEKEQHLISELVPEKDSETKEERKARRAAKKPLKEKKFAFEAASEKESLSQTETKEARKARKAAKRALKEQETKAQEIKAPKETEEGSTKSSKSKEERRERKRLKKLAQEAKDSSAEDSTEEAKKKKRRKE